MIGQQEDTARGITRLMIARMCRCPKGGSWIHNEQRWSVRGELCEVGETWPYKPHADARVDGAGRQQERGLPYVHDA